MFEGIADMIGVPEDQARFIILILAEFPLVYINYFLTDAKIRMWYGLITGFILQTMMFEWDVYHTVLATLTIYIFNRYFNRKFSSFWILTLTVLHLSFLHLKRMYFDWGGWNLDVSLIYMLNICKFSSITFSYEDGGKPDEIIKSSQHRKQKIIETPTLLETFSYIFYVNSAVAGPPFDFAEFRQYINLEGPYKNIPKLLAIKSTLVEFTKAIISLGLYVILNKPFHFSYCATEEFGNKNIFYKILFFNFSMMVQKAKYYGGWKLAQSALILSGLGYNPYKNEDGEIIHNFDRIENCPIRKIEIEPNPKVKIQYWNRRVHLWLKYNVFMRLINIDTKPFNNNKALASLVTFMVSAFWHGFYPLYYIFFLIFYILEQDCDMLEIDFDFFRKFENQNIFVRIFVHLVATSLTNYLGNIFSILDINKAFWFTYNINFLPVIIIFGLYFYLKNNRVQMKKKDMRERKEREMIKITPMDDKLKSN